MQQWTHPSIVSDVDQAVDQLISILGNNINLGTPIALGKPNEFLNALYNRATKNENLKLRFQTGLSLERPSGSSELEKRFFGPLADRLWGKDYPDLQYMVDIRKKKFYKNISTHEFYYKAGTMLNVPLAQQRYTSSNYTHAARDAFNQGLNVVAVMVAKNTIDGKTKYSLSSNPDIAIDTRKALVEKKKSSGEKFCMVAQVNKNVPYIYGDSEVDPEFFDIILEGEAFNSQLFVTPKPAVLPTDYAIGLNVSTLIKDGGTIQIGIGSLGDAMAYGIQLRHQNNKGYLKALEQFKIVEHNKQLIAKDGGTGKFEEGLYGATEMFVDVFLNLYKSGIMKREVYPNITIQKLINERKISETITRDFLDLLLEERAIHYKIKEKDFNFLQKFGIFKDGISYNDGVILVDDLKIIADLDNPDSKEQILRNCLGKKLKCGRWIDACFYLGPQSLYDQINEMGEEERRKINMTSVQDTNHLYSTDNISCDLKFLQRKNARFVNAGLMATLSGAVVSDGLEDGRVVSGVGGQFNFVDQAHVLPDGRSVLMIKATRSHGKTVKSNIVYSYGHITVPRHMRDIVVTEYGIADLRSQDDQTVMKRLLNITDSRFQEELLKKAKAHHKIAEDYQIPAEFKNNYPQEIIKNLKPLQKEGLFPLFPFGTDLNDLDLAIGRSLKGIKAKLATGKLSLIWGVLSNFTAPVPANAVSYLERMDLHAPTCFKERLLQKLIVFGLKNAKIIK